MRGIGYGICGAGEARRYMKHTLDEFARLCDDTIILCNNAGDEEKELIDSYGFHRVEDNREWGKKQNVIKEDFVKNHVSQLSPDWTLCLDMDEVFTSHVTRDRIDKLFETNQAFYVYVVNLWGKGYRSDWSFWNVRLWGWERKEKYGDFFYQFENRPLHCGLAPKWAYMLNVHAPFVLKHYGLKLKKDRQKKIERYERYDPEHKYRDSAYYEALKKDNYETFDEEKVVEKAQKHVHSLKQPAGKEIPFLNSNQPKRYLVRREADGFTFDVKGEHLLKKKLKQTFKGKGFTYIGDV